MQYINILLSLTSLVVFALQFVFPLKALLSVKYHDDHFLYYKIAISQGRSYCFEWPNS